MFNNIKIRVIYICSIVIATSVICLAQTFNVKDFGAVGNGINLDTEAIQKTVDTCNLNGGGIVFLPAGKYLSGTIILKDNVILELSPGATLLGSTNICDYKDLMPELKSYNDTFLKHALIYSEKANNIGIRGHGTIDGQGKYFKVTTKKKPDRYMNRPFVIRFVECKDVKIMDVRMQNSAMWMQQYLGCENVIIKGITVYNHANQNNDMIDIDGCKNFIMSDCFGDTDDDAITLKSTSPYLNENISITNCVVSSHCNALKFGTESTGGFRNVAISNIVIKPSADRDPIFGVANGISGITIGNVDGGILEGITIDNIRIDGTQVPLYLRLGNRARKHNSEAPQPGVGTFKDISISNLLATNVSSNIGCSISGIPNHFIENVTLSNITLEFPGGATINDAKRNIPELEEQYPEATRWGTLSSYGLYLRHVKNINLFNVEFRIITKDYRPAFVLDDVINSSFDRIRIDSDKNIPGFSIKNSSDIALFDYYNNVQVDNKSFNIKMVKNK